MKHNFKQLFINNHILFSICWISISISEHDVMPSQVKKKQFNPIFAYLELRVLTCFVQDWSDKEGALQMAARDGLGVVW